MVAKTGVATSDEAGIALYLPGQLQNWNGVEILICSSRSCGAQYAASMLDGAATCPRCDAPLDTMTWAERDLLPADTGLIRKFYTQPGGRHPIHLSIVLSGDDRSSIHRPQVCMTAAGHEILNSRVIRVPIEGRDKPLDIMVLDLVRPYTAPDGSPAAHVSYYAYWFVGRNRETASHIARMIYMATDRVLHGVSHRWAYIAMAGERDPRNDNHLQIIANFVNELQPALLTPAEPASL